MVRAAHDVVKAQAVKKLSRLGNGGPGVRVEHRHLDAQR
jgi:hypothetical protein